MFDPALIADDACVDGHLDNDPIYGVLLALGQKLVTGRLTIDDAAGENHMYFMQGRPVGVHLAEHFHPLGQLLLELGRMNGATFVRAQRTIAEGNRLPGQVYMELGVIDDASLKEVLSIQARRKAEHFCRLGSRSFRFCRGLTYLTGFTSTPLDPHAVIFLAVRQQMGEQSREAWLEAARNEAVRLVPPGGIPAEGAAVDNAGLPAPLANYGFGAPEERFLQRILLGFESVADLGETGTLPRDEMAVLLRYLEVIGRLQRRPVAPKAQIPTPSPSPGAFSPTLGPAGVTAPITPSLLSATAPITPPKPLQTPRAPTPTPLDAPLPVQAPRAPTPTPLDAPAIVPAPVQRPAAPKQVSALVAKDPEIAALQAAPLAEPTSEDVFSKPTPATPATPARPVAASPDAQTDPRRPAVTKDELKKPEDNMVFASALGGAPSPAPATVEVSEELPAPVVRKKKVKRSEPLPSEGSGMLVSETRREKTMITELPSIVIEDE